MSFFNTHYAGWGYPPTVGSLTFNHEPAKREAIGILARIIERLREVFTRVRILVRLDRGFAGPELSDFFEAARVDYVVVATAENKVLICKSLKFLRMARRLLRESGATEHVYGECRYASVLGHIRAESSLKPRWCA